MFLNLFSAMRTKPFRILCARNLLCLALFIFVATVSFVAEGQGKLLARGHGKYSIWQEGFFRIKFMSEGEEAVPLDDFNNNGYPDYVEDIAMQLRVAHHVFCNLSGFPSPLDSPRYKGAKYIDVVIRDKTAIHNMNGLTFDELSFRPDTQGADKAVLDNKLPKVPVLIIGISRSIDPKKNLTPTHEYFHQIQNGMTFFKNPWFYEGMAVWSESALGTSKATKQQEDAEQVLNALVEDAEFRANVFKASYKAGGMVWKPLAKLCSKASIVFPDVDEVLEFTYTDGSPVMQDREFFGAQMMRLILVKLGELENIPFTRFNYQTWTEANQRRTENNEFIVEAVTSVAAILCPQ